MSNALCINAHVLFGFAPRARARAHKRAPGNMHFVCNVGRVCSRGRLAVIPALISTPSLFLINKHHAEHTIDCAVGQHSRTRAHTTRTHPHRYLQLSQWRGPFWRQEQVVRGPPVNNMHIFSIFSRWPTHCLQKPTSNAPS